MSSAKSLLDTLSHEDKPEESRKTGKSDSDVSTSTEISEVKKTYGSSELAQIAMEKTTLLSSTTTSQDRANENHERNDIARARKILYFSHLMSKFSEATWQFSIVLFLSALVNYESLILVSSYGLVCGLAKVLFGSAAGKFVDKNNDVTNGNVWKRLHVARVFLWCQNVCVIMATISCAYLLLNFVNEGGDAFSRKVQKKHMDENFDHTDDGALSTFNYFGILLLVILHILGAIADLFDAAFTVAIERDWIVVMSESFGRVQLGVSEEERKMWLSETNVTLKQIDLLCKVMGPVFAGFFVSGFNNFYTSSSLGGPNNSSSGLGLAYAALFIGLINTISLVVELKCSEFIYYLVPALRSKRENKSDENDVEKVSMPKKKSAKDHGLSSLKIYITQPVFYGGIALAILYFNVLTFGGIMTAYLTFRNVTFGTIGVWRGIAALVGLCGTFIYRHSFQNVGVCMTGLWSILFQLFCMCIAFASLFVNDDQNGDHNDHLPLPLLVFLIGICASRVGLYVFDIAITQIMQELVPEEIRGIIGGTQKSLNSFFLLLGFCLGLIFPSPTQFPIIAGAGIIGNGIAAIAYTFGIYFRNEELLLT
eukprot:CAMPEP_0184864522 /NCGR_PEP_ID=MMETSP0580-20130426/15261_1 /TAXON_ID=1118495 /ORGANISM="Dactyliosolen fragilissimus" /LENGTH=594 /DNA_ID=CAMNT_0027363353 /DNA_START=71 /DNA_END=1855 /DNA_ORIENTATION=-